MSGISRVCSLDSRASKCRGDSERAGGNLPIGFLDLILGRSGADEQLVVELRLLDHRCWLLLLAAVSDEAGMFRDEVCGWALG